MGIYPIQKPYFWILKKCLFLLGISLISGLTFANPVVDRITSGNVSIQQTPGNTVINQSSSRAIINWRSFNINAGEKTHFQQPAGGAALNRIDPTQGASQIYGNLSATGKIILINQAGIYFGPTARVDVGGIIASTSDMSDSNFLADKYIFDQPSPYAGSIVNEGTIVAAKHGLVALVGTAVQNDGTIEANLGSVVLASGNKFTVDLAGDQLINFTIDEETATVGKSPIDGKPMKHAVNNTGSVIADGGKIIMSANVAKGVLDNVINMSGVAQARSVKFRKGEIILSAKTGKVTVSGKLIATGNYKKQKGGTIKVLGERVHIKAPAVIDASGNTGGGTILIGGNYQGKGPELNAKDTYIEKGAVIKADALMNGDGGNIIVWADDSTQAYGTLSARGGVLGGNGGFIETSGKNFLDVEGVTVNTLAPYGKTGTWLLDPSNIFIATNLAAAQAAGMQGADVSADTGDGGNPNTFAASGAVQDSLLTIGNLQTALAATDVIVTTTNAAGTGVGNITLVNNLTWSAATSLTLNANNNITIQANVSSSNAASSLTLNASTINLNNNANLTIAGGQNYNAPVTLLSDAFLNGTTAAPPYPTSGNIGFNSTINGAFNLIAVAGNGGAVSFGGSIGNITPLTSLQVGGASPGSTVNIENNGNLTPSIITSGNQVYNLTMSFNTALTSTTFDAGGDISFAPNVGAPATIDLAALTTTTNTGTPDIFITSLGTASISGSIGEFSAQKLGSLTISASEILLTQPLSGGNQGFFTAGDQTYNGITKITSADGAGATVLFQAGPITPETITFGAAVMDNTSGGEVALDFQRGSLVINNDFGSGDPFDSISIANDLNIASNTTISTTGNQVYSGLVTLATGITSNFTSTSGNISFSNTEALTGAGSAIFPISSSQTVTFSGNVGITTPLARLEINGRINLSGANTIVANTQIYNGLFLFDDNNATLSTGNIIAGETGSIQLNAGINPASSINQSLTLTGSGDGDHNFTLSGGNFGTGNALGVLSVMGSAGSGVDTLTLESDAATQTWTLDGNKSGSISLTLGTSSITSFLYSNLENLAGGTNDDIFNFTSSGVISVLNGGDVTGNNTLNLSAFNTVGTNNSIVLNSVAQVGFAGTSTVGTASFSNINILNNSATSNNSLQGAPATNTWNINSTNGGILQTLGRTLTFTNVQSLSGGLNTSDTFSFTSTGSVSQIQGNIGVSGTKILDLTDASLAAQDLLITLTSTSTRGFNGASNIGVSTFTDLNQINGTTAGANSITGANTDITWDITSANGGSISQFPSSLDFANFQTLTGGSSNDSFIINGGTIAGTINGGGGSDTLTGGNAGNTWSITTNNGGSVAGIAGGFSNIQNLIGGTGGDTFNFSSGVTLSSIAGDVSATNIMNFTGNPVTLVFTSTRNGTATTSGGSTLFTYSNIDQAQGSSSGTVQLPTTTTNTLTINADGSGSFSDPFIFNNTNNGFINFIGNSTDDIIFNGFTPSFTTVGSTSVSTQINGATYTFSGFGLIPTPAPTPTPDPTPIPIPIPIPDEALNAEVVQATTTNSSSNTGIHAAGEITLANFIYENAIVDQIVADLSKNNLFENQPLKINLNCGI